MSSQVIDFPSRKPQSPDDVLGPVKKRVEQGLRDRRRMEPVWHSNRAFAQGKFWLKWARRDRRLVLDPRDVEGGRQRYSPDLLTRYLKTAEGHLDGAEDRHDLLFRRDDVPSEEFTKAANDGLAYAWDTECEAARALARIKRRIIVDGTAAVRVRFDPTVGRDLGQVPIANGEPITDMEQAHAHVAELAQYGQRAQFKNLNEGRIVLEPGSVFNLVTPPGIEDERDFPWEAWIRPATIDSLIALYGDKAKGLQEEPLAALESLGVREMLGDSLGASEQDSIQPGKLDGHVAVVSYYERPCSDYPQGRTLVYAGEKLLDQQPTLPLCRPNGDCASGIVYFHYWRVEGRFWSRALIEAGKDIQRIYARRASQEHETIDRGQPYMVADKQTEIEVPREILQVVRYKGGTAPPQPQQGIGPGDWMWRSKEGLKEDLQEAMGLNPSELGENPANVSSYAQLALLLEQSKAKVGPVIEDFQGGVKQLEEGIIYLMRRFWRSDKMLALAGEEDMAEAVEFKAQQLPEFFLFKQAETTRPRSEAAELQLINDIYSDSLTTPNPLPLQWKLDSIKAGRCLPLPDAPADVQSEKAQWQNAQLAEGNEVVTQPWDEPAIHIPEHTELLIEAEMAGNLPLMSAVEAHIQTDQALANEKAQEEAAAAAQAQQQQLALLGQVGATGAKETLGIKADYGQALGENPQPQAQPQTAPPPPS